MDKLSMLKEILSQNPADAFARYGLAMEYASQNRVEEALSEFDSLLTGHPDYTVGYFMAAQTLLKSNRVAEAKTRLEAGMASAKRTGNQHAYGEMEALLAELA